ncbi:MAG: NFACT RNA binding domain-containing protein [Eubacterium sp.]|nr:NFACT RNA binding domain-containing protein [Eubacterium sp.]
MAFDGITIAALTDELNSRLAQGHIRKIAQPEADELLLTIQSPAKENADPEGPKRETMRLKLSANASLPLLYLTSENKPSPLTAPNFCMLLRKHLSGARITDVRQEGLERVVRINLSSKNELGDDVSYSLVIEIMGKHSNIIFLNESDRIIDSIKHVNSLMSSVREVLPGRDYFIPNTLDKLSPSDVTIENWNQGIFSKPTSVAKAVAGSMSGISQLMAQELCLRAGIDGDAPTASLNGNDRSALMDAFRDLMKQVSEGTFVPTIYYDEDIPKEFSVVPMTIFDGLRSEQDNSPSVIVERFYREKDSMTRIRSKSAELKSTVQTCFDRTAKKLGILHKQITDTEKKDKYKVYGELITTYGYSELPALPIPEGAEGFGEKLVLHCVNYHDDTEVDIPIDPSLSVPDNANRYFDRYGKLKRTFDAVTIQLAEAQAEYEHLESVLTELAIARKEEDLIAIRSELTDHGYLKKQSGNKGKQKQLPKCEPLHYISSDGYDIYVGKNNYQNEELTFKFATGNDWWFHAKQMPGSHVIVKSKGEEPPIRTFEEAAALAALFSKGKQADKLEIDYTQKKNVKKPGGGKPGFVVYYTNYSMVASAADRQRVTPAGPEEEAFL